VTDDGDYVAVNRNLGIEVYEKANNYQSVASLTTPTDQGDILYHKGSDQLFSSSTISIFYFSGNPPSFIAELTEPNTKMTAMSCSS
jgi:hypothetical protein